MRKNLLLSSTAIVGASAMLAMATPARADIEVTLSGNIRAGAIVGTEEAFGVAEGRGYTVFTNSEVKVQADGATDSGINYSGKVEFEADADNQGDSANNSVDESGLAFWGGFGRIEIGREDGAEDGMFVGGEDFQAGTGGIDGDTVNLNTINVTASGDAGKISYFTPRVGGFQAGVSFTPDVGNESGLQQDTNEDNGDIENHIGAGLNWKGSFSGLDVTLTGVTSLGDVEDTAGVAPAEDEVRAYGVGGGIEFGGLGIGAGYVKQDKFNESDIITVGAKYGIGGGNVSVGFARDDADAAADVENVYAVSADYAVLPGVTLQGDLTYNDADPAAGGDDTTVGLVALELKF